MTVVAPSVSTADKRWIKAFCLAMRHMLRASANVATIGQPFGNRCDSEGDRRFDHLVGVLTGSKANSGDQNRQDQGDPE